MNEIEMIVKNGSIKTIDEQLPLVQEGRNANPNMNVVENFVLFVGCGGVFFHGISMFSPWYHRRNKTVVVCIDDDKTEEGNALRQWPQIGKHKVSLATDRLSNMKILVHGLALRVEKAEQLAIVVRTLKDSQQYVVKNYWIIHSPDNHLCRMICHEGCGILAKENVGSVVYEITAGNDMEGGYAYGCKWLWRERKYEGEVFDVCERDYLPRHKDIAVSAKREQELIEHPMSCGGTDSEMSEEQGVFSNGLTACCLWQLAEDMAQGEKTKEVVWHFDSSKGIWLLRKVV